MSSFVYVLMHSSGLRFKVGKAIDIRARAEQLRAKRFRRDGSFGLLFDSEKHSEIAERVLHRMFAQWRCDSDDVVATDGVTDGASEFFSVQCYDRLVRFVEHNLDLLRGRIVVDLAEVFDIEERQMVLAATREQRRIRLEAKERDKLLKEEKRAYWHFENVTRPALERLSKSCAIEVGASEVNFVGRVNCQLLLRTFESMFDPKSAFRMKSLWAYSHSLEEDLQRDENPFYGVIAKLSPRDPAYHTNSDILNRVRNRFWNVVYEVVGFPSEMDEKMSDDISPSPQDVCGVTREDLRRSFRHDALQAWDEFTRTKQHLTLEETLAWLATWGTDLECPPPTCHT